MWGTTRNNINNMVKGVTEGFKVVLEIEGVGFRAAVQGKELVLQIGFSHEVKYPVPEGITMKVDKQTIVTITGIDARRSARSPPKSVVISKPEPYKGKGIRYRGRTVRRKEGKKK